MSALGVASADNLKPFQQCRGGKHKLCGLELRHTERPPTYLACNPQTLFPEVAFLPPLDPKKPDALEGYALAGSIFSSPVPESHRKADTAFITPAAAAENI